MPSRKHDEVLVRAGAILNILPKPLFIEQMSTAVDSPRLSEYQRRNVFLLATGSHGAV